MENNKKNTEDEQLINSTASEKEIGESHEQREVLVPRTTVHIIVGIIASITALGLIALLIVSGIYGTESTFFDTLKLDILILAMLGIAILNSFAPSTMWTLFHFESRLHYNEKLTPTGLSIVIMHIISIIFTLMGVGTFMSQLAGITM